jgi:hypothetical protein
MSHHCDKDKCRGRDGKDGQEGERGPRGKRGHHGHHGPTGPMGAVGATGPCCTGPTGPCCPAEIDRYYGYNSFEQSICDGCDVHFSQKVPNTPSDSVFTLNQPGDYAFDFIVRGTPAGPDNSALAFELRSNTLSIPGTQFQSEPPPTADLLEEIVVGTGIFPVTAVPVDITLTNITSNETVNLTTGNVNAVLRLLRLSS